jgi:hypothetical protein
VRAWDTPRVNDEFVAICSAERRLRKSSRCCLLRVHLCEGSRRQETLIRARTISGKQKGTSFGQRRRY